MDEQPIDQEFKHKLLSVFSLSNINTVDKLKLVPQLEILDIKKSTHNGEYIEEILCKFMGKNIIVFFSTDFGTYIDVDLLKEDGKIEHLIEANEQGEWQFYN